MALICVARKLPVANTRKRCRPVLRQNLGLLREPGAHTPISAIPINAGCLPAGW